MLRKPVFKAKFYKFLPKYNRICHEDWKEYFNKLSLENGINNTEHFNVMSPNEHWCCMIRLNRRYYVVLAHRLRLVHVPKKVSHEKNSLT